MRTPGVCAERGSGAAPGSQTVPGLAATPGSAATPSSGAPPGSATAAGSETAAGTGAGGSGAALGSEAASGSGAGRAAGAGTGLGETAVALVAACHPEPTVAVTAVSVALAVSVGRGVPGALAVAVAVLAGQLSVGWSNDYLDRDRDEHAGRGDKPVAVGRVGARTVGTAAVVAAIATIPLSLLSGLPAGTLHVVAVASAWTYNLLLKSTAFSVLPYAVSFGLLPAFVTAGLPGHPVVGWLVAAGALLGAGAHFANVLPDLDDDLRTGVRGLPHRIGARPTRPAGARRSGRGGGGRARRAAAGAPARLARRVPGGAAGRRRRRTPSPRVRTPGALTTTVGPDLLGSLIAAPGAGWLGCRRSLAKEDCSGDALVPPGCW